VTEITLDDLGSVRGSAMAVDCSHLDQITITPPEEVAGCEECMKVGDRWVHLRVCMTCGKVGCCDSSPNKHASRHARDEDHPIVRSAQPGETWLWCYVDEVAFEVDFDSGQA
jgi:uncharacterized UBP type Zn finger protein